MTRHRLNPNRLRTEIVKRGIDGRTLARQAGVSAATVSHVVNGRSANPRTLSAIVRALIALPVVEGLEGLLEEVPIAEDDRSAASATGATDLVAMSGATR